MTASALTAPLPPADYATERTPLADEAYIAVTLDRIFADLRDTWPAPCGTCAAVGERPCVTRSGRVTRRHRGRSA